MKPPTPQFSTPSTPIKRLSNFLSVLHPLATEHELIRIGANGDGGYLVPDDLAQIAACFSPGVANISEFELDCAKRGMQVYLADKSVDGPATHHPNFHFIKKNITALPSNDSITLRKWMNESDIGEDADLLLQFDIEGGEYEMLLDTPPQILNRFRIIIGEFHMLQMLFSAPFFNLASRAFAKLTRNHACVHIHPNNCTTPVEFEGISIPPVAEFTFIRKDRFTSHGYVDKFPHPLDQPNTAKEDFQLPYSLWRSSSI